MTTGTVTRGTVEEFDDGRGLGVIRSPEGLRYPFHCTAIAGGSRSIPVGADALFTVVPGHSGRWEASAIVRI